MNFEVSFSFFKSHPFSNIVYTKISLATLLDEGALSNPFIFWISVLIKIAAHCSDISKGTLYTKVVKSSLIISVVSPKRHPFSFMIATTCLSNITVLAI